MLSGHRIYMSSTGSGFGGLCWAWPLSFLSFLRLSAFGRNANLAGGFAGRRVSSVVGVCLFWFFPLCGWLQVHGHSALYSSSFYHFYLSGPSLRQHRPHREKKMSSTVSWQPADVFECKVAEGRGTPSTWEAHMTRPFFQPKSSPISRPMKPRRSQSHIPNCASCCSKSFAADTQ